MRRIRFACCLSFLVLAVLAAPAWAEKPAQAQTSGDWTTGLAQLREARLPEKSKALLGKNGFVLVPSVETDMVEIYASAGKKGQPQFITTDAVLHAGHIFFDYLLRILEIDQLYAKAEALTDAMLALSTAQYEGLKDPDLKEAARLNIGFFAVAKAQFSPGFLPGHGLDDLVKKELKLIDAHQGLEPRPLLPYVKNPSMPDKGYAFEDYSQYVPRGHYTRNEQFGKYFKALMWYGRLQFDLVGVHKGVPHEDGRKMTLQALLIADALAGDAKALRLWRQIYEPTAYFVGKADDLDVDDYMGLARKVFTGSGPERFADGAKLAEFMTRAGKLRAPKILSGAGSGAGSNPGFRFMGQRFIPDSHMFQELVYGASGLGGNKPNFQFGGSGKPLTMEVLPVIGPARAFPMGLDVMAVLGSKRAAELIRVSGNAAYSDYEAQVAALAKIYGATTPEEWRQNLYWRWFHALLPLLEGPRAKAPQAFLASPAWADKNLQTALGSWAELRHDTILYAKQSYTGIPKSMMIWDPDLPYGYVEPESEVYGRLAEMFGDLRKRLESLGIASEGIPQKLSQFEEMLKRLRAMSELELAGKPLAEADYEYISHFDRPLRGLLYFPPKLMSRITSDTDSRMDLIADVHTDPNTKQVLEVGVGSPADIFVLVRDERGYRVCRGAAFTFYEFKQPMAKRLSDEQWQKMGADNARPPRPDWARALGD